MTTHSTAIIDPSVKLGKNVTIDPYVIIGPNVVLGDGCVIRSHAVLEYAEMGENCIVYPHTSIGLPPQHLKYNGEPTKVVIGPRCQFREGVTVHRGTQLDHGITKIGSDGFFMALSHIAHDCQIGNNVIMANGAQLAGHVQVGNNVFISTTVGIHQFVRIGTGSLVSGGAMVPMDVAPFCNAQGDRAELKGINIIGMRRMGYKREDLKNIKQAYKLVFLSNLKLEEALESPFFKSDDPVIKTFTSFLKEPKRGFVRPSAKSLLEEEAITV